MENLFRKAERSLVYLKLGVTGPTGSGKTFSALRLATGLLDGTGKRIAFLDTENDSASLYSDQFDFDVMTITPPFESEQFLQGINAAIAAGYGCCIIDSASHFWKGILEFKDAIDRRGGNGYTNWKEADKKFDPVINAVLQGKIHTIFCMRSKMDYILEDNGKGKMTPKKVGLAPVMRDGIDYEFSTVFDLAMDHTALASKDRSGMFPTDKIFQITEDTGKQIASWLKTAKPKEEPSVQASRPSEELIPKDNAPIIWKTELVTFVETVAGETRGKPWKYYKVTFESGKIANTFSESLSQQCMTSGQRGDNLDVSVKPGKKEGSWELLSISVHADEIPM